MEKIFQETNNYIDTLRISQEKETKLQWIIDFIIKIGLEKEFLQSFEENSKNFLFRNPITDYQSTTIISQVDEIISNNKSIFQSINSSFLEKIDNLYRSLAYNTFIVSELSTIFDNAFDLQDKNAFKTITNFINSSNIEGLVDKYKNLWISRLSTYLNSLFSMTNNSCIPKLISVYNFIKSFNDEIPSGLQGDLLLLLQRFLNDSNTFGIYMIARYIHNIIVTEEVTDQKMKDVVSILSLFDDTDQFSQFYHHFLCNRLLRYFTPPPAIEKNSVISFSPFIEESIMKQINRMMDEMENVEIFEHSSEMNIKFIAVTSGLWIVPLSKQLFVPPEVEIARESYRKHYKEKFPKRALNFTPLVDHVTFKYKGVSWSGFYPYLAVLMAISEDKNIFEIGLTQKCIPEVVNALLKLGLIQRMAGKYILASNFKPQRKLNKLPQLSIFLPQVPRKLDHKELFSKKKPKLEFLITRTMKNYEGVSADELYQQIANTSQFSIHRKEFDCCIASLIATEQITMDCNQKLHYNPF
ncbi:hypothetical protein TVAG_354900 [Trichomonas vaginalis G3]|uniref:Cullin family profile domain-containing protein n=1 Tax=Trichomonas vaginalis (strain ATCC PRA-98 / G3) TaxID=412133 RepID=A2EFX5_TRIV3|nr:Cullin homology domain family [Trichomonas vaginalis G3]EAY08431.1 hypothetical protein TVAG_354900 [Trichomonas vaginalis G3]KAI5518137.1 Cullin homology domain family [Trichomonas vaginalis G3]|eukprot:XP_001320654.1 hypothetical protein [Trichomonas vaginalis G3]